MRRDGGDKLLDDHTHFFQDESSKDHIRSVVAVDAGASVDRLGEASLICSTIVICIVDIVGRLPWPKRIVVYHCAVYCEVPNLERLNVKMGMGGRFLRK